MTVFGGAAVGGPTGATYSAVVTRGEREAVLAGLAAIRFSGWVGPQEGPFVVAVPSRAHGAVAGEKMRMADVARTLAAHLGTGSLALTVDNDQVLWLWASDGKAEIGEYVSNPTVAFPGDEQAGFEPEGAELAGPIAAALGAPEKAAELEGLLAEELGESENESERLTSVLRLLALPDWVVASEVLPKDVPGGPRAKEFTKLGAGREGVSGVVQGKVRDIVRKKH